MSTDNPTPKPRTIDERLEGLTQTVEISAVMQRDNERRFGENERRFGENERRFAANEKRTSEIMEGIARLLHVAEIHEQRQGGEQPFRTRLPRDRTQPPQPQQQLSEAQAQ